MRLLVTGGAGYIGGFVTRLLVREGHDVTVIDSLASGHPKAVGEARLVVEDFGAERAITALLKKERIEAVLHFAGLKSVPDSWVYPQRYIGTNVEKTASLLTSMVDARVPLLVYSGSCAIYGMPVRLPVDENHPAAPLNPYARSKWLAELEIKRRSRASGIRHAILRYFNAAGADPEGQYGEELTGTGNLVPIVMKAALGFTPHVPIHGTDYDTPDGTAIRDYVHVLDLAEAHLRAVEYLENGGSSVVVNLGTGAGTSVREIVNATIRITGRQIAAAETPRREGDAPAIVADPTLACDRLGWRARHHLDDILDSAWQWYVEHPRGYAT